MMYDALTIDTNVVYPKFELDAGLVGQLNQFKGGLVQFLLSEINAREIHKALTDKAKSPIAALSKAINSGLSNGQLEEAQQSTLNDVLKTMVKPSDHATKQLDDFVRATGCEIVAANQADMTAIVNRYFKKEPPFAIKGKKSEFPDAIALLSLENWAIQNQKRILAVSDDDDWKTFADQSEHIDVVGDLGKALTLLNELADETAPLAREVLELIRAGNTNLVHHLRSSLEHEVESEFPHLEFDSPMPGEDEGANMSLVDFEIDGLAEGNTEVHMVRVGTQGFAFRVPAHIVANVYAEINFAIRDSKDKDYVPMGSTSVEREVEFGAFLLFEISHSLNDNEDENSVKFEIENLELLGAPSSIDIGYIEYSLADDYYEFEFENVNEEPSG